jgi:pimeloyl-ACP methyl ester carboxylesterase
MHMGERIESRDADSTRWPVQTLSVGGGEISLRVGGDGPPLVVLPRDNGHPPRHEFLDLLAGEFRVHAPWLPGFHGGHPEQWEWAASVRDLAIVELQLVQALGLERYSLVGLGFGGWIAAEMATMCAPGLESLALVAPMGIQPRAGFIHDQFLVSTLSYAKAAFSDPSKFEAIYGDPPEYDQLESWETDREMTSRVAWKPYMYDPSLPRLLAGLRIPALIVWGDDDRIVPAECGELYRASLAGAHLEIVPGSGHAVDLEQPAALASLVSAFLPEKRLAKTRG